MTKSIPGNATKLDWPNGHDPASVREYLKAQRGGMTQAELDEYEQAGGRIAEVLNRVGIDPDTKRPYAASVFVKMEL